MSRLTIAPISLASSMVTRWVDYSPCIRCLITLTCLRLTSLVAPGFRTADIDALKRSFKANTKKWSKYGFETSSILPELRLNAIGYALLNRSEYDKAVKIFKYNLELYPKSFNAHDSLAEAFLIMGDKENAIKYYQLAVKLNPGDSDFAKRVMQNSKDKLQELRIK